ncbi:MAG TPA: adenylate/guanylate cyclase domain-containing protein [Gaiellaceae bacterium]|nr:adenylate/guanylate cyclase domain-containing protein [Gaiellaceae bacterium]
MTVCGRCGQENPEAARFCLSCGASLQAGELRQERKVVTVLFADLVGFTSRAEALDPEDVGAMLEAYHSRLKHELERHGGTVEKFIGDAVMALFGAPTAHEDDPERAVRAALQIRDAIAELNDEDPGRDLHVRVGITTGEALVTLDARPDSGQGMAAGDVVNTAARLQAQAPEDGVLVDESTRRAVEPVFDLRPCEPVVAKGKADPIPVFEVVDARASFGIDVEQDARTPLVGRERERDVLEQALARVRTELAPQLVTLIGVPGIGKTRLVWELFRIVDDDPDLITWRQGRCLPYGDGIAFWALGEMVKAEAGLLETDEAEVANAKLEAAVAAAVPEEDRAWVTAHLRPLVGLAGESGSSAADAFGAWRLFFEALAEQRPVVLVFEDLHWADDGLLDFVDYLVDWAVGVPLLVVCSARPELLERRPTWGGGKLNAVTLALSPLGPEDAARLVATLLEQPLLPAALQHALLDRAEGNPLYAEQYVRMLVDRGFLVRGTTGWELAGSGELPLPETLQGIIAARLDGLPGAEKQLLQDAAVVGKVFWLGAVDGKEPDRRGLEALLHALERKGFVRRERRSSVGDETEYAFGHALVRDVAYGQIPRIDRARKHRAVAEWIEQLSVERSEGQAELAAHHWLQALELTRAAGQDDAGLEARARAALVVAGERAYRLGAIDPAAELYGRALSLTPAGDPDRPRLLLVYGRAASRGGIDAGAELTEAIEQLLAAGEVEQAADGLGALGWVMFNRGRPAEARATLARAVELVDGLPPSATGAYLHGEYAINLMLDRAYDESIRHATIELEVGREIGADWLCADALITLGSVRSSLGDDEALALIEQGLELARRIDHGAGVIRGHKNLQSFVTGLADLERARAVAADGQLLATRYGDMFHVGWFEVEQAWFDLHRGEWDGALRHVDAFFGGLGEREHYMAPPAHLTRGRVQAERGDLDAGLSESQAALELARAARDHQVVLPTLASHAIVLVRANRAAEAHPLLDELIELVDRFDASIADAALALNLLGRDGDFERIREAARDTRWGAAAEAFAAGDYATAADRYRAIGDLLHEAESRLRLGEEAEARAAASFFRRAGAPPRIAEAEAAVRAAAPRAS